MEARIWLNAVENEIVSVCEDDVEIHDERMEDQRTEASGPRCCVSW